MMTGVGTDQVYWPRALFGTPDPEKQTRVFTPGSV